MIHFKGNSYILTTELSKSETPNKAIFEEARRITNLKSERIRITYFYKNEKMVLDETTPILEHVDEFFVKDLGPQFGYQNLFFFEYLFPFVIMPLVYKLMREFSKINKYSFTILLMWTFHYLKRLYETFFVHIFSHATVPISVLFKNCIYYWGFALAISINVVRNSEEKNNSSHSWHYIFVCCFVIFELCNYFCHKKLRSLRINKQGQLSRDHQVPYGIFFNRIACPNYTFEILSWISFSLYARITLPFIFACVGGIQMYIWAIKKRKMLIKLNKECSKRGTITPFRYF